MIVILLENKEIEKDFRWVNIGEVKETVEGRRRTVNFDVDWGESMRGRLGGPFLVHRRRGRGRCWLSVVIFGSRDKMR